MRKIKLVVVAVAMAVPMVGSFAPPANACMGEVCDAINAICYKTITKGHNCLG